MRLQSATVFLALSMLSTVLHATKTDERINFESQYYLLKSYRLIYTDEIFDYCVEKNGTIASAAGACMRRQDNIKNEILDYAHDQLGRRSLAQGIYDDCTDYHPESGVRRISKCVKTRLMLDKKLQNDFMEKLIYQKCDARWRKHGSGAINNCSTIQAKYYREKGRLRD